MSKSFTPPPKSQARSFTLIELVVVIIIIAILASLGLTQYNKIVEKSRLAEAMGHIVVMRTFAYQYYLEHGSLDGIQNSDVGENFTCTSTNFFQYGLGWTTSDNTDLAARRCSSDGKAPDAARAYDFGFAVLSRFGAGHMDVCVP